MNSMPYFWTLLPWNSSLWYLIFGGVFKNRTIISFVSLALPGIGVWILLFGEQSWRKNRPCKCTWASWLLLVYLKAGLVCLIAQEFIGCHLIGNCWIKNTISVSSAILNAMIFFKWNKFDLESYDFRVISNKKSEFEEHCLLQGEISWLLSTLCWTSPVWAF